MFQNKLYIEITAKLSHFPPNGLLRTKSSFLCLLRALIKQAQIKFRAKFFVIVTCEANKVLSGRSVPFLDLLHVETRFI